MAIHLPPGVTLRGGAPSKAAFPLEERLGEEEERRAEAERLARVPGEGPVARQVTERAPKVQLPPGVTLRAREKGLIKEPEQPQSLGRTLGAVATSLAPEALTSLLPVPGSKIALVGKAIKAAPKIKKAIAGAVRIGGVVAKNRKKAEAGAGLLGESITQATGQADFSRGQLAASAVAPGVGRAISAGAGALGRRVIPGVPASRASLALDESRGFVKKNRQALPGPSAQEQYEAIARGEDPLMLIEETGETLRDLSSGFEGLPGAVTPSTTKVRVKKLQKFTEGSFEGSGGARKFVPPKEVTFSEGQRTVVLLNKKINAAIKKGDFEEIDPNIKIRNALMADMKKVETKFPALREANERFRQEMALDTLEELIENAAFIQEGTGEQLIRGAVFKQGFLTLLKKDTLFKQSFTQAEFTRITDLVDKLGKLPVIGMQVGDVVIAASGGGFAGSAVLPGAPKAGAVGGVLAGITGTQALAEWLVTPRGRAIVEFTLLRSGRISREGLGFAMQLFRSGFAPGKTPQPARKASDLQIQGAP